MHACESETAESDTVLYCIQLIVCRSCFWEYVACRQSLTSSTTWGVGMVVCSLREPSAGTCVSITSSALLIGTLVDRLMLSQLMIRSCGSISLLLSTFLGAACGSPYIVFKLTFS